MDRQRTAAFLELTRPFFLGGGVLLYALGVAIAHYQGNRIWLGRYLLGQALVTSIQLMTQYANEYYDLETDRAEGSDRTWFSGGSGVLATGRLEPSVALFATRVCGYLAVALLVAVTFVDLRVSAIGGTAAVASLMYSMPPARLVSRGVGEIVASLVVAGLVPVTGLFLHRGELGNDLVQSVVPLIALHMAMLIAFELPDELVDRATGKRTLTVRLGRRGVSWVHTLALIVAAYFMMAPAAIAVMSGSRVPWIPVLAVLGTWQLLAVAVHPARPAGQYRFVTTRAVALFAGAALLQLATYVLY